MARVTSKLQVTIPKAVADRYGIEPGTEIAFESAGDVIRVVPQRRSVRDSRERVKLFDQDRGWTREDLYDRGRPR